MAIANIYPAPGGAEHQAFLLSRELSRMGYRVQVLTQTQDGMPRREEVDGVAIHRCVAGRGVHVFYTTSYVLSWLWHMIRLRREYDVIHCHQIYYHALAAGLMRRFWGKRVFIKVVNTGAGSDIQMLRRSRFSTWVLSSARRHARIFCIARSAVQDLESEGFDSDRLLFVPNGVDVRRFKPDAAVAREPGVVLFVGRFAEQKNVPGLLSAVRSLLEEGRNVRLVLIRSGGVPGDVEATIDSDERLRGRVDVLSGIDDMRPYFQRCAMFVLPSLFEGVSNALLEAMASECPVIATAVGGNVDLLDPDARATNRLNDESVYFQETETGVLIRPGDAKGLAKAMAHFLENDSAARRAGEQARLFVMENYDIKKIAGTIADHYQRF